MWRRICQYGVKILGKSHIFTDTHILAPIEVKLFWYREAQSMDRGLFITAIDRGRHKEVLQLLVNQREVYSHSLECTIIAALS